MLRRNYRVAVSLPSIVFVVHLLLCRLQKHTVFSFISQLPTHHGLKAKLPSSIKNKGRISISDKSKIQNQRYLDDSFSNSIRLDAKRKKGKVRFGSSKQGMENLQGKIQRQVEAYSASIADNNDNDSIIANPPILIVDSNNVRGVDNFKFTNEDLIKSLASWRKYLGMAPQSIVCVIDHGCQSNSFVYDGISLVFAGPNRTADDVIAHDCQWFVKEQEKDKTTNVYVVTNDRELRSRCKRANSNNYDWNVHLSKQRQQQQQQQQNHKGHTNVNNDQVQVFSSMHLSKLLKKHWDETISTTDSDDDGDDDTAVAVDKDLDVTVSNSKVLDNLCKVENDIRLYERPAFKNRKEKRKAHRIHHNKLKTKNPIVIETLNGEEDADNPNDTTQEELLDILQRPLGDQDFHERTWHRVFIAEQLRTILTEEEEQDTTLMEDCKTGDANRSSMMELLSRYHSMHNSFNGHPVDMLYDQRIRNDQYAKQSLSRYLQLAKDPTGTCTEQRSSSGTASLSSTHVEITSESNIRSESNANHEMSALSNRKQSAQASSSTGMSVSSSAAEDFMKQIVSQGTKSQSDIIKEYSNTAPQHIQFRKTKDIRELLKKVAIKEKRPPDYVVRWYLLQQS